MIVLNCAFACPIVAPGARRAIIELNSLPRPSSDICCGVNENGTSSAVSRDGYASPVVFAGAAGSFSGERKDGAAK